MLKKLFLAAKLLLLAAFFPLLGANDPKLADALSTPLATFTDDNEYPDRTSTEIIYGFITCRYEITGVDKTDNSILNSSTVLERTVRRAKDTKLSVVTIRGNAVADTTVIEKGKEYHHVVTTVTDGGHKEKDVELTGTLVGSKKLGLCRFVIPPFSSAEAVSCNWSVTGKGIHALGPDNGVWPLSASGGDAVTAAPPFNPKVERPLTILLFDTPIRIPNRSSGKTAFAAAAKNAEDAGKDAMGLLVPATSGLIEAPWDGSYTHGSFAVDLVGGDSASVRKAARAAAGDTADEKKNPNSVYTEKLTVTWSLTTLPPEDVELVVEPLGYDKWTPEAGKDEKNAGNTILINATLQTRDGKAPKSSKAARYNFDLEKVSHEPGICINYPAKDKATADADLQFEQKENENWSLDGPEHEHAQRLIESSTTGVYVSAFDYGAYGAIKVSCLTRDGQEIVGHLKNGSETVLLPLRAPDSCIADAWKVKNKLGKVADADDTDTQHNNDNKGDGFTLYEEYRGVYAMGDHQRLDPTIKDLVVENRIGEVARPGLDLFEKQSGIHVIELKTDELDKSRVVNLNHTNDALHKGDQCGLILRAAGENEKAANKDAETSGSVIPADFKGKMRPKDCTQIDIYLDGIKALIDTPEARKLAPEKLRLIVTATTAITIAHEMAHACGVPHHGKASLDPMVREIAANTNGYEAYDVEGKQKIPTPDHPVKIEGDVGAVGGPASGNTKCIMCYDNAFVWCLHVGTAGGTSKYFAVPALSADYNQIFCTSRKGTGMNADSKMFGDATTGKNGTPDGGCMAAFNVKDW